MAKNGQDERKKSTNPDEMTQEELVAAVIELQKKNVAADVKINELTEKLNTNSSKSEETISDLEQKLNTQTVEAATAIKQIEERAEESALRANETIKDLQSKLESFTSQDTNPRSFKSGDLDYEIVVAKLRWEGQVITAEEIITNDKLREAILEFAWEGRSEADFNKNGIFKIVY